MRLDLPEGFQSWNPCGRGTWKGSSVSDNKGSSVLCKLIHLENLDWALPCWRGFPSSSHATAVCLRCRRPRLSHWLGKTYCRRQWLCPPAFLPGEFHGQRNLVGWSPWGRKDSDATEPLTLNTCWRVPGLHQRMHTRQQIMALPALHWQEAENLEGQ